MDYIVEGEVLPKQVNEIINTHNVSACFVGYKDISVDVKVKQVRDNSGYPNDWTSELSDFELKELIKEGVRYSEYLYTECQNLGIHYVDFSGSFEKGRKAVVDYLHSDFNSKNSSRG